MHCTQTWIISVSGANSSLVLSQKGRCAELSQKGSKTKQAYAVTGEDGDSLKVYGGNKLLSPTNNGNSPGGGLRKRNKNTENQLLDGAAINTDSDSDLER